VLARLDLVQPQPCITSLTGASQIFVLLSQICQMNPLNFGSVMANSNTFSTVANAFATIGLADTVFRNGKHLYELYERCQGASKVIPQLLNELKAVTSIIAHTTIFLHGFESSPFALEDGQTLPQIQSILTLCGQEFEFLRGAITANQNCRGDGWLVQLKKSFTWALEDQKVAQSCQRLQRLSTSLTTALSVTGRCVNYLEGRLSELNTYCIFRQNDLVIRKEIQATRDNVALLTQKMERYNISLAAQFQQSSTPRHRLLPDGIPNRKAKQNAVGNGWKQRRYPRHRRPALPIQEIVGTVHSQQELPQEATRQLAPLAIVKYPDQTVELIGSLPEGVAIPFILMRNALAAAFNDLVRSGLLTTSKEDAQYIQQIIDHFIARYHETSADTLKRRRSVARLDEPQWSLESLRSFISTSLHQLHWMLGSELARRRVRSEEGDVFHVAQAHTCETLFGVLNTRFNLLREIANLQRELQRVDLFFINPRYVLSLDPVNASLKYFVFTKGYQPSHHNQTGNLKVFLVVWLDI
jgi:hypothetical protein